MPPQFPCKGTQHHMVNFTSKLLCTQGVYSPSTHYQSLFPDRFANQIELIGSIEQDEFEKPIMTS
ncbi:hypothetical protein COB72_11115 [bacterium]|nr:MAG: hypothetical protein COB72_11115 [bacterium]